MKRYYYRTEVDWRGGGKEETQSFYFEVKKYTSIDDLTKITIQVDA